MQSIQPRQSGELLSLRQKWLLSTAVILIFLILLLLLAEGVARVRQWYKYGAVTSLNDVYTTDKELGLRVLIPGQHSSRIGINSSGFRGPEVMQPKPEKTFRVAFVGASTTYCAEVSRNEMTWPHLVTTTLRGQFPELQIDYVNAGVPGYIVASSLKNLRLRVAPLQPDAIILYEGINDLSGEMRDLAIAAGLAEEDNGETWLERRSILWSLVRKNLRIRQAQHTAATPSKQLRFETAQIGHRFKSDLTELVREAKRIAPLVAVGTLAIQVRPEQTSEAQGLAAASAMYYMPSVGPKSIMSAYSRYNEIIRQVAAEQSIIVIGEEHTIPGDMVHFNDTVHFKDAGSVLMAKRVSSALLATDVFRAKLSAR